MNRLADQLDIAQDSVVDDVLADEMVLIKPGRIRQATFSANPIMSYRQKTHARGAAAGSDTDCLALDVGPKLETQGLFRDQVDRATEQILARYNWTAK